MLCTYCSEFLLTNEILLHHLVFSCEKAKTLDYGKIIVDVAESTSKYDIKKILSNVKLYYNSTPQRKTTIATLEICVEDEIFVHNNKMMINQKLLNIDNNINSLTHSNTTDYPSFMPGLDEIMFNNEHNVPDDIYASDHSHDDDNSGLWSRMQPDSEQPKPPPDEYLVELDKFLNEPDAIIMTINPKVNEQQISIFD